ncbi:50S ribosomal protein-like protein L4 [Cucurbitaria berberidis CBS 394.84]|uniref:Large ribosomal subunit protein uL4m n=1 Tax=Cucurbitaria berberidis CBS 394.84 TaxID=1168544 RepID=A0A9P4GR14_9PLEO|nr:50S ribosomal protein-like protein L4 [Cucurbitaria berberidis CBS 394.84]KAF1849551.1 50S ribosomal protein-like protein L4 [Cucurbitaria berberidis CBS 394.84]
MASTRISAPMRGVTYQLSRLSIRQDALSARYTKSLSSFARSISTSTASKASVSSITRSVNDYVPVKPLEDQTVFATIHQFPSLEPLRFESYPANHLHLPTRRDILHRAVIYEGDMTRLGTASTKTRHEIRGSARKVRPQKGSGRARLGDKKSPMLRGGGVAFGPQPRDFATDLQKKVYDLAWRTALSYRFRKGELIIVDNAMEIESPSTRLLDDIFKHHEKLRGKGRSLLVTLEERPLLEQALIEMDRGEQTLTWEEVDVKNLLELSRVIIERDALHNILLTHQEDLTHKAITPWHKSLIRSSPPEELESTIGWQEFRALSLTDPKEHEAARADAYESVASTRYAYAESLSTGPKRNGLTVSAYNLLAEAKELQFAQKTGLPFREYTSLIDGLDASEVASSFPRIQALDYQINVKSDLAATAAETSRLKGEELMIDVRELEVQKLEIQYEAALLSAQVYEHVAEAQSLAAEEIAAEDSLSLASSERTNVDMLELQMLEARLEVAKQKFLVAGLKNDFARQKKAQEEVRQCTELAEAKRAEVEAWDAQMAELGEVEAEVPAEVEESRTEPVVEAKKEERK